MKVKCISDRIDQNTHKKWLIDWANTQEQLELTVGKTYVVLAIAKYVNNTFFYILGDETVDYPLAFPSLIFEVSDFGLSRFWKTGQEAIKSVNDLNIPNDSVLSFPEWNSQGDQFYEKVLEEDTQALKVFHQYRDKMLTE